jgi:hypothetical protein
VIERTARALAAAAILLATIALAADSRTAFAVGVLRRDGIVLPFALFDGKRWSAPWPPANHDLAVPIDLRAVPRRWWGVGAPLDVWALNLGRGTQTARVLQPDWVDVHCARYIGLRTDYRPLAPPPPRSEQPYPKDGLAVSPPHDVERIEIVAPDANELRTLLPLVHTSFNEAEREVESHYGHPIRRRAREGLMPTIEAAYAYGDTPRIYYIEATRSYRQLGQPSGECAGIGSGTGWFVRDAAGARALTMVVDVLNCDRQAASYMLPLGVVRSDNRVYWLAQFSGWDHERYVVLELKKKAIEVIVNRWGGAC